MSETHSFFCNFLSDILTTHFKKYSSRFHDCNPKFRITFTRTHSSFSRSHGYRFIRKNSYPDLTTPFDISCHSSSTRFNLTCSYPATVLRLESILTECDCIAFRNGDPYAAIGDDKVSAVQLALGSSGVPETFVIGGDGRIVLQHVGDIREEDVPGLIAAVRNAR